MLMSKNIISQLLDVVYLCNYVKPVMQTPYNSAKLLMDIQFRLLTSTRNLAEVCDIV